MSDGPRPMALLRHADPRHGAHFDLLLSTMAHPEPEQRCAIAWRMLLRPTDLDLGATARLVPLPEHRALYLSLAERMTLDGGRGEVEPVALGRWHAHDDGRASLAWIPHAPPMIVRFALDEQAIDARDLVELASATVIIRES